VSADTDDYMRFFPYAEPYANQREAMDRIYNTLTRGQDVLFEGACGTGKTLSALVPAMEYAREAEKTVVITTNVHQQMRQFVTEARAITREEAIRAVVFKGKGSMCHIDVGYEECQALRDTTRDLVDKREDVEQLEERQEELLEEVRAGEESAQEARSAVINEIQSLQGEIDDVADANVCDHYLQNLTASTDGFYEWLFDDVRTPEEIYEQAGAQGFCGYELLKEGIEGVDLVVANYHHLLDPMIREQFFRWLGRDPSEVITVFDEAHNVEDAARDHATQTLTEQSLDDALDELESSDDPRADRAANVLSAFRAALVETYEDSLGFGARERIGEDWEDVTIANEDGRDDLTLAFLQGYTGQGYQQDLEAAVQLGQELDEEYEEAYKRGEATTRQECQTLSAARFVGTWMQESTEQGKYPVAAVRRDQGTEDVYGRVELYTCIPQDVTSELFAEVHATVLMSATLQPFGVAGDVLGLQNPVEMEYGLAFPEERRRTFAVGTPALFASKRDDVAVQDRYGETLADVVRFTPGNTLAFFPNYAEAERYATRLREHPDVDSTVYLDEAGVSAEDARRAFTSDDDAVLLTSLWGTLAEGVSFDGDDARTVAVVGVPYPHLDDRAEAVQRAYGEAFGSRDPEQDGWRYAVEIPTIRKTRQALGRVLRSPEDFGVRVLLDERYTAGSEHDMGKYSVHDTFPPHERDEMVDIGPQKLKFAMLNFYQDMDAYGPDGPPAP